MPKKAAGSVYRRTILAALVTTMWVCLLLLNDNGMEKVVAKGDSVPECQGTWKIVPSPNNTSVPIADNFLVGVSAVSSSDIWAVGYISQFSKTVVEHWDGTQWRIIPSANVGSYTTYNLLAAVSAVAADDVWAVGRYIEPEGVARTLTEHWDGMRWSVIPSPDGGPSHNLLEGIVAVASNDVWAVGHYYNAASSQRTLILHWNGSGWSVIPSPNPGGGRNALFGVTAVAANDIWAVGFQSQRLDQPNETLTIHWNGTQWRIVPSPNPNGTSILQAVTALATDDVWAVGHFINGQAKSRTLAMHWDGSRWSIVATPNLGEEENNFTAVAALAPDDVWAVGYYDRGAGSHPLMAHWRGSLWETVQGPDVGVWQNNMMGVVALDAQDIWAVGYTEEGTLVERYTTEFTDVVPNNAFYPYVQCLACRGMVVGYGDGAFRPNSMITRGQLAKIVSNAAGFAETPTARSQTFQDVYPGSLFYLFVERVASRGIIGGYECGGPGEPCGTGNKPYFRPNADASRGQIAKLVGDAAQYNETPSSQTFEDIAPSHSFYMWVERLAVRGIMGGYPCGSPGEPCGSRNRPYFRSNINATRGQVSKIVANTFFPNCDVTR